jgi:hypothetical protein
MIKGMVIHEYLCYNIVTTSKQYIDTASLIKEMPEKEESFIYSIHCIDKAFLYSGKML